MKEFRGHLEYDFMRVSRTALATIPSFRVLDDHDFGKNGFNAQTVAEDTRKHRPYTQNSLNAFNELWPTPVNDGQGNVNGDGHGFYYKAEIGNVEIWFLNNRYYSHANGEAKYNLLGQQQKTWLKTSLRADNGNGKVKFIVTPLPFIMGKKPDEDFRSSSAEWVHLIKLFAENGIQAIFCADSHNYSRSEFRVTRTDGSIVRIPHFIVGMLGGWHQGIKSIEKDRLN